jgi:gamma-glutamyl-gamma-aminobutyrate hydrolase PuuD/uncharacterized protein YjbI with pentapeptide repeats
MIGYLKPLQPLQPLQHLLNFSPKVGLAARCAATVISEGSIQDKVSRVAFLAGSVAISAYFSKQMAIANYTYSLVDSLYQVWKGKAECCDFFEAFKSFVQLGALIYGGPYLFAMSYAVDAISYTAKSYKNAQGGYYIEALSQALLSLVYARGAKSYAEQAYKSYGNRKLNDAELDAILADIANAKEARKDTKYGPDCKIEQSLYTYTIDPDLKGFSQQDLESLQLSGNAYKLLDLEAFLKENGFSRHIKRVDFSQQRFVPASIKGVLFDRCKFPDLSLVSFEKTKFVASSLDKIRIQNCNFNDCLFDSCNFKETFFQKCHIMKSEFTDCLLDKFNALSSTFSSCKFTLCSIQKAQLFFANMYNIQATTCDFSHTVLPSGYFGVQAINSKLRDPKRPVIALGAYLHGLDREKFGLKIEQALIENGADVLLYDKIPQDISLTEKDILPGLSLYSSGKYSSRAVCVLENASATSQIGRIKALAKTIIGAVDGLVIPGGDDVPEAFYLDRYQDGDYAYALMEFALLSEAEKAKKQTLGICRGLQMINVYFGGSLKNTPHGHGLQKLEYVAQHKPTLIEKIFSFAKKKGFFYGFSHHSQAVEKLGKNLRAVLKYKDTVKAFVSENGLFVGLQFHPEAAIDSNIRIQNLLSRNGFSNVRDYSIWLKETSSLPSKARIALLEQLAYIIHLSRYNPSENLKMYSRFVQSLYTK